MPCGKHLKICGKRQYFQQLAGYFPQNAIRIAGNYPVKSKFCLWKKTLSENIPTTCFFMDAQQRLGIPIFVLPKESCQKLYQMN
jgi:hypothetical protein